MLWKVRINNKQIDVAFPDNIADNEPFWVCIDGKGQRARWHRKTLFLMGEDGIEVPLCVRRHQLNCFADAGTTVVQAEFIEGVRVRCMEARVTPNVPGEEHRPEGLTERAQILRSSIPGKVLKVFVSCNDSVMSGDLLLIVEAMKMENKIHASASGKITFLGAKEGDAIAAGAELVRIEN
jgi:biotin carboxyl carrier protein